MSDIVKSAAAGPTINPESAPSLLTEYRQTFGSGFRFADLWRDRRAILTDPGITTRDRPPLANSPLRFALALGVVPMLVIGWLTSQLAGVMYPDATPPFGATGLRAAAVEQQLATFVGTSQIAGVKAIARSVELSKLPLEAQQLNDRGKQRLKLNLDTLDAAELRREVDAWLVEVQASALTPEHQRVVAARMQLRAYGHRGVDAATNGAMRSMMEGGWGMQVVGALSLVAGAFLFRWMLRRDPRFPLAARADRLFLYFVTSRILWFTVIGLAGYGVTSFASASGNLALLQQANVVTQISGAGGTIYLLMASRTMARSLSIDGEVVRGAAFSLGWRLVVSQLLAILLLAVLGLVLGIAIGIGWAVITLKL